MVCVAKTNSVGAITTSHSQNKRGEPLFFFLSYFIIWGMKIMTKVKPMSMKRINIILEEISDYQLEKLDNGEIVMVKKEENQ